ncbi:MAG: electron transport complex subunit RsxC, partial [Bacteroidetes bacterium HGW-Bacteroidetes-15]
MKTFKLGGVHPKENKLSANKPIEVLTIPNQVSILVSQHLGVPANVLVERGDKVKIGQLIAKGEAFISANIHSSVSGTVKKIDKIIDASGYAREAVIIDVEGNDWEEGIDTSNTIIKECKFDSTQIIEKIKEKGVVGLGGAAFPSHVKLMPPKDKKADYLIINSVECEPYLTADHQLMMEKAKEIIIGVTILMKGLGAKKALIGIENNKPDAIKHLTELTNDHINIEVHALKVKYPQGAEKQLIKALVGREVPSGKLPIEVGCVVNNVGTAYAVYEAVQKNKPLIERVVTVTGKSVKNPCNLLVRVGTPISSLIEKAGGIPEDTGKIIGGGPMMGKALSSIEVPVTKGTSGILLMDEEESKRDIIQNCIRCAKCTIVCPMGLEPYQLALQCDIADWEGAEKNNVMDCIECGSCQ